MKLVLYCMSRPLTRLRTCCRASGWIDTSLWIEICQWCWQRLGACTASGFVVFPDGAPVSCMRLEKRWAHHDIFWINKSILDEQFVYPLNPISIKYKLIVRGYLAACKLLEVHMKLSSQNLELEDNECCDRRRDMEFTRELMGFVLMEDLFDRCSRQFSLKTIPILAD